MSVEATTRITADELFELPDDGKHYELVRGVLRVGEPPGAQHGSVGMTIGALLFNHVRLHGLGVVFTAETGFLLARDPDTVRAPDAAFVRSSRIPPGGPGPQYFEGAPDLAVEVIAPSDTLYEVEEKVAEYLEAGSRLVWVVSPKLRRVTVHEPGDRIRVLSESESLDGGEVVPGFRCEVREIFDWRPRESS
jgi:Uma2 family endonuclease